MSLSAKNRYWAVAGQDSGTCESLGWVWSCVRPYICATGADESATLDAGVAAVGHDDVYVYDSEVAS